MSHLVGVGSVLRALLVPCASVDEVLFICEVDAVGCGQLDIVLVS